MTQLLTQDQRKTMLAHHQTTRAREDEGTLHNPHPVVRLFTPDANATWLLTELDPDGDIAFGLCDLGLGFPELGFVSLAELESLRGPFGLPVERDAHFEAQMSLSAYADQVRHTRCAA